MRQTFLLWLLLTFAWSESALAQTGTVAAEHHYAVTLLSSFEPIPDALLPTDLRGSRVYRTQSVIFGKTIYFIRLGFFNTPAEATAMRDELKARYPGAYMTEVTPEEYKSAAPGQANTLAPAARQAPPAAPASEVTYVVTLATSRTRAPTPSATLPAELTGKRMYLYDTTQNGTTTHNLQLGFFATAAEAEASVRLLIAVYPEARVHSASGQERDESGRTVVALPGTSSAVTPPPASAPLTEKTVDASVDSQAADLMEKSRAALTRGDNTSATQFLNKLLRLPPNAHTQDAQELIGLAQERQGNKTAALQEYKLYLRLYPEGLGSDRVRQRLLALEAAPARVPLKKPERSEAPVASVRGSLSQYYYYGQSQTNSTTTVLGPTTDSVSGVDQSALYTNLDLRGRYTNGDWDNRVAISDNYYKSFQDNTEDTNRLYSAYYETSNKVYEISGRFGRQPGTNGGVLGRFDGVTLGYNILPKWRLNVMAGAPAEFYDVNYSKSFWSTSLDFGLFDNHWNGSVYYIQQTVDGIADRQAIGTELRYFDPKGSALLYVDYDTLFGALNIATLQATWLSSPGTTWNALLDHRLAPTLMTSNALFSSPSETIQSLLTTMTEEEIRQQAAANSPTFDTYMLGVSHNLNSTWQIGGDVKRYNLSAAPSSPNVTTTLGTGATMAYTVQTIANGLFRQRDLTVLSLTYLDGVTYQGESLSFTQRMLFRDSWTIDLALNYYVQKDEPVETIILGDTHSILTDSNQFIPRIRVAYLWGKNITLEAELGVARSNTHSVDNNITTPGTPEITDTNTSRRFYSIGYRWNF